MNKEKKLTKEEDLKQRRTRIEVRTALDNALAEVMYWVEDSGLEMDKTGEDFIINILFDQSTIQKAEKAIGSGEKTIKDLISSSRSLGKVTAAIAKKRKAKKVTKKQLKEALIDLKGSMWPYN
jgi:hypothetical protein